MSVNARDYAKGTAENQHHVGPPAESYSKASNGSSNGQPPSLEILKARDEARGAAVHSFNPDASPEKKGKALNIAKVKIGSVDLGAIKKEDNAAGEATALEADIGGMPPKTSVSISDVQDASAAEGQKGDQTQEKVVPGVIPAAKAQVIPDWYKIGWSGQFADKGQATNSAAMRDQDILEVFLGEMYYGAWYHNAAIIFFAVAASHYVTLFGGGWAGLIIVLATCATYYQTSTRRVHRNIRDDMARELARTRLFTDHETVDWMNNFLHRFWLIYEPVLSATIVASVDQVLEASTPGFLDSLRLTTFTLGTKAPRIDFIRTHPETADDEVVMDWMINFTPNDTSNLKVRMAEAKVNPKIVLGVGFGKGVISATKDIVVEDIMFKGDLRIRMKLMNDFPHIQIVDLSFLTKPDFDFVLKPVGFDINMIPGLSGFIHSQVHANLGPMMYDPNVFTLNMEQMLAGAPVDTAVGVLQITINHAQGIKCAKIGGGAPDPYISFSIGNRSELDRTKIKHSSTNPHWNSTHFLLVNNLTSVLSMNVMDYNSTRKDGQLGIANFDLQTLASDAQQEGLVTLIMHEGKPRGEVYFDATFYPCLTPKKLENGMTVPIPETSTGVLRLTLHQAKDIDPKKLSTNNLAAYAQFFINGKPVHKSSTVKRTTNPVFESFTEMLISDKASAVVGMQIMSDKAGEDHHLGYIKVKLTDILEANAKQQDWFPLLSVRTGKIRMSATWKPVLVTGAITGAGTYRPPIGVLRFWFKRAADLKNVEALTGGKSDPYVRVMRSGIVLQRTQIINNNLDPKFDEITYVPVHNLNESLRVEVMDYQHLGNDRSLGFTDINLKALVVLGKDKKNKPFESTGKHEYAQYLNVDVKGTVKGQLFFEVAFHPCTYSKFSPFQAPESSLNKLKSDDASGHSSTLDIPKDGAANVEADKANMAKVASGMSHVRVGSEIQEMGPEKTSIREDTNLTEVPEAKPKDDEGIELTRDQLFASQSGVMVFNIMSGEIAKKNARLEFLFDDGYWPAYSTEASRSTHAKWDETGEGFIRELDWSQVILKLNTAEKDTREEVYAQYTTSLKSFMEECLDKPAKFTLHDLAGGSLSTVYIQCKYIPVPIELEPRESINNMGMLTVMVDNAKGLKAADRNGYSDPYAQFTLNGMKCFKSDVKKKTLNPTWDERFEVEVPSRVHANFYVDVFDWDRVGAVDKLGRGQINLADIEPMMQTPMQIPLVDQSSNEKQGVINLRMTFRPGFIIRSRQATSTFSGLGRAATGLGSGVIHAGAGVGHVGVGAVKGVGNVGFGAMKGVGKGVGGVGKLGFQGVRKVTGGGHTRTLTGASIDDDGTMVNGNAMLPVPFSGAVMPAVLDTPGQTATSSSSLGADGKLIITVASASGLGDADAKPYCVVKLNGKIVKETKSIRHTDSPAWGENFQVTVSEGNCELEFAVFDKKILGKPKEIASVTINVWNHLQPHAGKNEADVHVPLSNNGNLHVRLSLNTASSGQASFLDTDPNGHPPASPVRSQKSTRSRFSMHRERTPFS